jgi:hypothetical protein
MLQAKDTVTDIQVLADVFIIHPWNQSLMMEGRERKGAHMLGAQLFPVG